MAVKQPYKFGANKRAEYLKLLSEGTRRGAAAEACGVTRETVRLVMRDDPDFAAAVDEAEMAANELVEDALFQAASSGNVIACFGWLYNRDPERWQDKRRVETTGADGGAIQHEHRHTVTLAEARQLPRDERRRRVIEALDAL